ncbi:hypothetical protein PoB_003388400 [Plakobranchus ocellatus]|uniref:Uncharacterized protein n=1 Tax=Plakobranchus ocellatus TaxID=259542 RepID=A0AAV4AMG8_9GAST|nr:hypothetical protein PoB_003388400 [Plakobranchus ocellatus]
MYIDEEDDDNCGGDNDDEEEKRIFSLSYPSSKTIAIALVPTLKRDIRSQDASDWVRARDRRVPADLRADSLISVPPAPLEIERCYN